MVAPEILLVEPDDTLAAFLIEALAEAGYRAMGAASHEEALALCAERGRDGYHLVIAPPSEDTGNYGSAWLERLRRHTRAAVVLRVPWESRRQTGGGDAMLHEPFTLDDMMNIISALLRVPDTSGAAGAHKIDVSMAIEMDEPREMGLVERSYLRARAALDQLDAALMEPDVRGDALAEQGLVLAALRGDFILCSSSCPRDGCAVALFALHGRDYIRVCYGAEQGGLAVIAAGGQAGLRCPHCGVRPGQWHHIGCFFEMCPICGESLLDGCSADHAPPCAETAPPIMDAAPRVRTWSQPEPQYLARLLRRISPQIGRVHAWTGVNVRPSVRALMAATSTGQMRETLHRVDSAELDALRLFYHMIR